MINPPLKVGQRCFHTGSLSGNLYIMEILTIDKGYNDILVLKILSEGDQPHMGLLIGTKTCDQSSKLKIIPNQDKPSE